jgi:hypothetical protein
MVEEYHVATQAPLFEQGCVYWCTYKTARTFGRMADRPPTRRKPGRPKSLVDSEPFQLRVSKDQRARWRASTAACAEAGFDEHDESKWARSGLDHWTEVCDRAIDAGVAPGDLLVQALEDRERAASVVKQLEADQAERALLPAEERILRTLAPTRWERLSRAGALALPPKQRRA